MDYVRSKNQLIRYYAIPDSAFYVDYNSLKTGDSDYMLQMKALYATVNDPEVPFPQSGCVTNFGADAYKCFVTEYMFPYIRSPLFIIQSGYDTFQIPNVLQSRCSQINNCTADDLMDIHAYHTYQQNKIRTLMQNKPNSAVWSPSCPFHCNFERGNTKYARLMQVPMNSGITLEVALKMFTQGLKDEKNWIWLDDALWPENTPCAFFYLDNSGPRAACE